MTWKPLPKRDEEPKEPIRMSDAVGEWTREYSGTDGESWTRLIKAWDELGSEITDHAQLHSLKNGLLTVVCADPSWTSQLSFMTTSIKHSLNETCGDEIVQEVVVKRRS